MRRSLLWIVLALGLAAYAGRHAAAEGQAAQVLTKPRALSASGVHGGLAVHLGCRDAALLAEFAADPRFLAHGLTQDAGATRKARAALKAKGSYGRGAVEQLTGRKLPYADHLVRLLVVEDALGVAQAEMLRVLCPGGVLWRKADGRWSPTVKPWPKELDEWTHARHGPEGSSVSRDQRVGMPTNVRWISGHQGGPRDLQVYVTAGGRLFGVMGQRGLMVVALDAFSGVELWSRPYAYKHPRLGHRAFWRQAPLIAVGDRVYIAGRALDAATGEEAFAFEGNPQACADGVLVTSRLCGLDARTGRRLWRHPAQGQGAIVAEGRVYFVEGPWPACGGAVQLVCLDLKTGREQWRNRFEVPAPAAKPSGRYDGYAPSSTPNGLLAGIVHYRGVLALEVTRTYVHLLAAADGRHLRSLRYKNWSPYASGLRALMIGGLLWLPEYAPGEKFDWGATINAYSLETGEKVKTLKLTSPIRQRCRPPLASERFLFLGGLNVVDLATGASGPRPIVRSACHIGLVPANGLLYVPPTHCRCYSMIAGLVALESRGPTGRPLARANGDNNLQTGSAYGRAASAPSRAAAQWPSFRQGALRRAHAETALPDKPSLLWDCRLADGALAWRNLAAPARRRIVARSQLESAWPARGSVAVVGGTVCAVAGRHNMAEGGIVVTAFDLTTGKKEWQRQAPCRELTNPLTGGAYEPRCLAPSPRPSAAALGGWLVSNGPSVQVDRLGAFSVAAGEPQALFDGRLVQAKGLSRFKNGSLRPDFDHWLLAAEDGKRSCRVDGGRLVQVEGGKAAPIAGAPDTKAVAAVASARDTWVVAAIAPPAGGRLLLIDKHGKRPRAECRFQGTPVRHGVAVASGRVFLTTTEGRLLCFGASN
jgi:outer membrane protein assembly factor BamB